MLEYAERRAELSCTLSTPSLKRRRALSPLPLENIEEKSSLELIRADADLCSTRIMTFGSGISWPEIWCVIVPYFHES